MATEFETTSTRWSEDDVDSLLQGFFAREVPADIRALRTDDVCVTRSGSHAGLHRPRSAKAGALAAVAVAMLLLALVVLAPLGSTETADVADDRVARHDDALDEPLVAHRPSESRLPRSARDRAAGLFGRGHGSRLPEALGRWLNHYEVDFTPVDLDTGEPLPGLLPGELDIEVLPLDD